MSDSPALVLPAGGGARALTAIIVSAAFVGLTIGYAAPLMALMLEAQGYSSSEVGINAMAPALATILLGPLVPWICRRLGFINALILSLLAEVLVLVTLAFVEGLWLWFALRFLMGMFGAIHWIGSETWIIAIARPEHRGKTIAFYMISISGGFAAGAPMILLFGSEGSLPLLAAAAILLPAAPLLWLARNAAPRLPPAPRAAFAAAFRIAPLVILAALLAGFTDMAALTHLAIYGLYSGMAENLAVLMLSVMLLANLALQFPLGWLADRLDRRQLLIGCGGIFFVAPLLITLTIPHSWTLWPVMVVWGGASLGIYTLALTILGDRFPPGLLAAANAAVVAIYQFGAILGQPAGGAGMDLFGPNGLMYVLSGAAFLFLGFAAWRSVVRRRVPG